MSLILPFLFRAGVAACVWGLYGLVCVRHGRDTRQREEDKQQETVDLTDAENCR